MKIYIYIHIRHDEKNSMKLDWKKSTTITITTTTAAAKLYAIFNDMSWNDLITFVTAYFIEFHTQMEIRNKKKYIYIIITVESPI